MSADQPGGEWPPRDVSGGPTPPPYGPPPSVPPQWMPPAPQASGASQAYGAPQAYAAPQAYGASQQAYGQGPYAARPSSGTVSWAMGFLQFIPAVGPVVAGVVMAAMYPSVARHGGVARENARGAANWGLTLLVGLVIGILLMVIFGAASGGRGFFPTGIGLILIMVIAITHLVVTIVGTVKASGGRAFSVPFAIPFIRR